MNLFNIQNKYTHLAIQLQSGELTPELEEALKINEAEFQSKALAYGHIIQHKKYNVDMIKKEIERLKELQAAEERIENKLKQTISTAMQLYGIEKVDSPTMKLSFRKSESIEIVNEAQLTAEFVNTKQVTTPDKVAIKTAIKEGREVAGAVLVNNLSLQIK